MSCCRGIRLQSLKHPSKKACQAGGVGQILLPRCYRSGPRRSMEMRSGLAIAQLFGSEIVVYFTSHTR